MNMLFHQYFSQSLYDEIVVRGRGGWCHELNGLFCWALREVGFDARMCQANAWSFNEVLMPDFDHMVIVVDLGKEEEGKKYLADVGWGESRVTTFLFSSFIF